KSDMVLGLGTGSTFNFVLEILSEKVKSGEIKDVIGISTSTQTLELARKLNFPIGKFSDHPKIDLTIDGADEVDEKLNVIKGGGGALLHEKIIAQASKKVIIVVDQSKVSKYLGEKWAVPIEVIQKASVSESEYLKSIGASVELRKTENNNFITDEGNYILDADFGVIKNPKKLAKKLNKRAGIVEHGLFVNMVDHVIVASDKDIQILTK
ncbi:MAG: ribose 5-phosphate isomerase A, partial [Bacteroidota bacterium]